MSILESAQPSVEDIQTEARSLDSLLKKTSLSRKLQKKYQEGMSVKNANEKSNNLLKLVQIELIHPGDAYYGKGYLGITGIFKIQKGVIFSAVGWDAGWFMPVDIVINPKVFPVFMIGIKFKTIKKLTNKEMLFWQKILDEHKME